MSANPELSLEEQSHVVVPGEPRTSGSCGGQVGDEFWTATFSEDGIRVHSVPLPLSREDSPVQLSLIDGLMHS